MHVNNLADTDLSSKRNGNGNGNVQCVMIQFAVNYTVLALLTSVSRGSYIAFNIDAVISSVCMVLLQSTYDSVYYTMCGCVDRLCRGFAVPQIKKKIASSEIIQIETQSALSARAHIRVQHVQ